MAIFSSILVIYLAVILFPFIVAELVTIEVQSAIKIPLIVRSFKTKKSKDSFFQINKTKRHFENIAFQPSVYRVIKQKIESISNVSDKAGFTCFDWFLLDSHAGLKV